MTTRFSAVDLAVLPKPQAIEVLSHDEYVASYRNRLVAKFAEFGISYDVGDLETDPAMVIGQAVQFERVTDRQRVNDAVAAVLLPTAQGTDLDNLAARYLTTRLAGENDERLRYRTMLAYEALATTGTYGGYTYFALGASTQVRDVVTYGPETGLCEPGEVLLVVLGTNPQNGGPASADPGLLDLVASEAGRRDRRPLTDRLIVRSAALRPYRVTAHLTVRSQIDPAVVRSVAESRLIAHVNQSALIGEAVSSDSIIAALGANNEGQVVVTDISLREPTGDVNASRLEVPWCTSVVVTASSRGVVR